MSLLKPLIKAGKAAAKVEVKDKPFFSAVDKAALELARTKGTGKEFMTELKKVPGVKPAEIQHRKLERIEALPKMEKADFLKELEANPPVNLRENIKLERTPENLNKLVDENNLVDDYYDLPIDDREMIDRQTTAYDQYRLPGGSNYREILLQTPTFGGRDLEDLMYLEAMERRGGFNDTYKYPQENLARLRKKREDMGKEYNSAHWEGDPNVLAHMRVQDRAGPNGEKILHVEEIQSDWHQAGRKKGYGDTVNEQGHFTVGVPDAPFKKNWHELAMKRLINYAAENGYDSIAITPGAEQAKRYDLSQHINEISYGTNPDGTYSLTAIDKNGKPAINKPSLTQSELEDTVGKDMAKKIVAGQGAEYPAGSVSQGKKSLTGIDLQVGGEGMEGFYDKMLPDYLNSFGKKYGSQVGSIDVEVAPAKKTQQIAAPGIDYFPEDMVEPAKTKTLHTFPITPEMREEVTSKGMPLYQKIGVPLGTGAAGAEMEVPEPVEQVEEPAYAAGGAVYNTNPDMSDGGQIIQGNAFKRGGKVHVSHNTDAMFMDVHDKMFKRK